MLGFLIWLQVMYVTMVYGPIAAFLVELFQTSIRHTSMFLPYDISNGVFGGIAPLLGIYLIAIAFMTFVIGCIFVPETHHKKLSDTHEDLPLQKSGN